MNKILLTILFLLMIYIDKKRGIKLFLSLCFNFIILIIIFYLMALGINPIITSLIGCLIISYIKTKSSLQSVVIVLIILAISIFLMTNLSRIAGFGYESYEEINMFSYDINMDFTNITIAIILISLIGATVDSSVAISTSLYEVHEHNKKLSKKELFQSGLTVGKDILCTTTNTLLFAFLGDFMTLVIWYYKGNYTFLEIINSKTFCAEFIKILFSATGCVMIIPITAYITTNNILKENRSNNNE